MKEGYGSVPRTGGFVEPAELLLELLLLPMLSERQLAYAFNLLGRALLGSLPLRHLRT